MARPAAPVAPAAPAEAHAPIKVRAVRNGFFKTYRTVGDVFEIPPHLFSKEWHEELGEDDKPIELEDSLAKRDKVRSTMKEFQPKAAATPAGIVEQIAKLSPEDKKALRALLLGE